MNIRYRNTASARFELKRTISSMIATIQGAEMLGWSLDVSCFDEGLELDSEGVTVHFCKFSDKPEVLDINEAHLCGFRIPTSRELREQRTSQP